MRRIWTLIAVLVLALALAGPALAQGTVIHTVQAGENLYRIALRYGVTVDALAVANGLSNVNHVYTGQRLVIPTSGATSSPAAPTSAGVHIVQAGENLYRIALRYGLTTNALAAANGIINPNAIYTGQRLTIPGAGSSAASPLPAPPASAPGGETGRWIDVNLTTQQLTAYEGNTPVRTTLVSTGLPGTPTPTGQYRIYVRYAAADMSGPGYYLTGVPYVMYFYRGYSLHGTYWHANFGHPMSHGCVNLPTPEAEWLYSWASVGTLVNIHY